LLNHIGTECGDHIKPQQPTQKFITMTATLENVSLDDLLAFLRSDSPPPKRAATDRAATPRPAVVRRLPTALESAIERRPPMAGDKYKAAARSASRSCGDYSEQRRHDEHTNILRRVECRIVAWLVCRALGPAWRFEPADEEFRNHRLVHRATTATLSFRRAWNDGARYEIVPENVYRTDSMPRSISVSAERSPSSIAGDISRRLISAGLFDQNAALLSAGHARRADEVKRRRETLAIAQAYGGKLKREDRWQRGGYPAATNEHFGPHIEDGYNRRETEIAASSEYNGLEISVTTQNLKLAIQIAELVRGYYN
jgi:hypothetical protein